MKNIIIGFLALLFIGCAPFGNSNVHAQGFHHPPPPPQHHHSSPPPQIPQQPIRFSPPIRQDTMRPPSDTQKMLHQWKNEVVDRVRSIANDLFGFDDDSDLIKIEDPWEEHNWGEHDSGDASFQNHDFEATRYKFKPLPMDTYYISPDLPDYPLVDWGMDGYYPETFSMEGPTYTLDDLPDVALKLLNDSLGSSIDLDDPNLRSSDDPNLRFLVVYGSGQDGITVIAATEVAPGVYEKRALVRSHDDPYHTTVINGETVEISTQWKDVNVISLAKSKLAEVDVKTANININDYNDPSPVVTTDKVGGTPTQSDVQGTDSTKGVLPESQSEPVRQPVVGENAGETPVTPEIMSPDLPQEPVSPVVISPQKEDVQEITTAGPVRKEFLPDTPADQKQPVGKPREIPQEPITPPLMQIQNNLTLQQWLDLQPKQKPKPQEPMTITKALRIGVEQTVQGTVDISTKVGLVYVNVQFPLVGTVISGVQGAKTGYDKARKAGADVYQAVWNGGVGATTNVTTGLISGKVGGGVLTKLKVINPKTLKALDVTNTIAGDQVSGMATDAATDFKPALIPLAVKYFLEGVPTSTESYQNYEPGTYGARGGMEMEIPNENRNR